jgi:hypothetical protein
MNMVYVASRFEIYRRRENLSWSHHATVAPLEVGEQEYWLARASAEKLSVADLRVELRGSRRTRAVAAGGGSESGQADDVRTIVCPNCGEAVPLSH